MWAKKIPSTAPVEILAVVPLPLLVVVVEESEAVEDVDAVASCPTFLLRRALVAFLGIVCGGGEGSAGEDRAWEEGAGGDGAGRDGAGEDREIGEGDVRAAATLSLRSKSTEISFCWNSSRSSNSTTTPLNTSLSRNSSGSELVSIRPPSCSHKNVTIVGSQSTVLSKRFRKCLTAASSDITVAPWFGSLFSLLFF